MFLILKKKFSSSFRTGLSAIFHLFDKTLNILRECSQKMKVGIGLKGVFAKNERGYRLKAKNNRL